MENCKRDVVKFVAFLLCAFILAGMTPMGAVFAEVEMAAAEPRADSRVLPDFNYDAYFIEKGEVSAERRASQYPSATFKFYNINAIWLPWKDDVTVEAYANYANGVGNVLRGYVAVTMYDINNNMITELDSGDAKDNYIRLEGGAKVFTFNGETEKKMTTHSSDYNAAYAKIEIYLDEGAYHKTFLLLMPSYYV